MGSISHTAPTWKAQPCMAIDPRIVSAQTLDKSTDQYPTVHHVSFQSSDPSYVDLRDPISFSDITFVMVQIRKSFNQCDSHDAMSIHDQ